MRVFLMLGTRNLIFSRSLYLPLLVAKKTYF